MKIKNLLLTLAFLPICSFAQDELSTEFVVFQPVEETPLRVYTNPFNEFTRIEFWKTNRKETKIDVINARGTLIERITKDVKQKGLQLVEIDTRYFAPGVYFVLVEDQMSKIVIY